MPDVEPNEAMPGLPGPLNRPEIRQAMDALAEIARNPEMKAIYEQRRDAQYAEKARFDEAYGMGYEHGYEKGRLVGQVEALRGLLGQEAMLRRDADSLSYADLKAMADALRQQLGR